MKQYPPAKPLHTPLSDEERVMLDTDIELSQLVLKAVEDRDFDLVVELLTEKLSIGRALDTARWETFNRHMNTEFFGDQR